MNDEQLDRLVRGSDPIAILDVPRMDLEDAEHELLAEILASAADPAARPARSRGRRMALRMGFVAVCVAIATVIAVLALGSTGDEQGDTAYAEAVKVAEANRRLLVTQHGWTVNYAQWDSPTSGEVDFVPDGGRDHGYLDIHWYGADEFDERTRERGKTAEIAGTEALTYPLAGPTKEFAAVLPPRDGNFVYIRGSGRDFADFERRLDSIVSVDVDAWLDAMPDSVVPPADQGDRIDELLKGVPLPEGFDRTSLEPASMPQDDYQFTYYVLSGAYCGWLDEWWRADRAGDEDAANAAIAELLDAENWPAVQAAAKTGSIDHDFAQYAEQVAEGYGDKQVYDQMMNCIEYP